MVLSLLYAFGVDRARNDNYFVRILIFFSLVIAGASILAQLIPKIATLAYLGLFCLYYANFAVCTNHFWTFTADFFDSLSSKRLFPIFTVGASAGGLLGGILASAVANQPGGAKALLWGWIICSLLAAAWLRFHRGALRRWGPLEIEEADESSVDGMKSSIRFLRASRLGRLMVLSALFMVASLFVSQYIYSGIFVAKYPSPDELAQFFGIFLAAANALELFIEIVVTPWLLSRFGIANANLFHPILTLVSFGVLGVFPGLGSAVFARLNRETLENSVGAPIRNLIFNALPARLRGRMRAFLEGIVVYSGMACAGLFLLVWEQMHPASTGVSNVLCWGGFLLACGFLATNYGLKKDYLEQLLQAIRDGRLELDHSASTLETLPTSRIQELWGALAKGSTQRHILKKVATALVERNALLHIKSAFQDGDERMRLVCLEALHESGTESCQPYFHQAAGDESAKIRLYALAHLNGSKQEIFQRCLEDSDPNVRATAAIRCEPKNLHTFEELLASDSVEDRIGALTRLPKALLGHAKVCLESETPAEVQAAIRILTEHGQSPPLEKLRALYLSPSVAIRKATVDSAGSRGGTGKDETIAFLMSALGDNDRSIRRTAVERFKSLGQHCKPALADAISSPVTRICHGSIEALAELGGPEISAILTAESGRRAKRAWLHSVESAKLRQLEDQHLGHKFLALSLEDAASRDLSTSFRLLEALEEAKIVRSVEKVLKFAHARIRADALEVLSNLGDREATSVLVHLLEEGDIVEREAALVGKVPPSRKVETLIEELQESEDRWLKLAANNYNRGLEPGSDEDASEDNVLMEHLLMLRSVPLFATMTLEQLEAIHLCLSDQHYTRKELVFNEGDVGDEMYIVASGEVEIMINLDSDAPLSLTKVEPGSYFGEMSILDNEPRSAAAITTKESRLLVLKGEQLKELVYVMPEIAFTIFKVLSERLRRSDQRLRENKPEPAST